MQSAGGVSAHMSGSIDVSLCGRPTIGDRTSGLVVKPLLSNADLLLCCSGGPGLLLGCSGEPDLLIWCSEVAVESVGNTDTMSFMPGSGTGMLFSRNWMRGVGDNQPPSRVLVEHTPLKRSRRNLVATHRRVNGRQKLMTLNKAWSGCRTQTCNTDCTAKRARKTH